VFHGTLNGLPATILIDSGAQRDFVSACWIQQHSAITSDLEHTLRVRLANGQIQATRLQLPHATLSFGPHSTTRSFTVTDLQAFDVILGKPWLTDINPDIDWSTNAITSPFHCSATSSQLPQPVIHLLTAKRVIKALRNPSSVGFYATLRQLSIADTPSTTDHPPDAFKPSTALSPDNESKLHKLLDAHRSTFASPSGLNPKIPPHRIHLQPDAKPPPQRSYRMSPAELQEVQRQLEDYLSKGWIRPSTSEFGAPILFVRKKDGQLRMCIDFRALNAISLKEAASIPRIDELFDQLHGAKFFTSWDMSNAYNVVLG
jgi:hypothetical protein